MGGMIAVAYAERYPQQLESMMLASPCGVSPAPNESIHSRIAKMPWGMRKTMFKWAINLWEGGHTPQGFAQSSPSMFGRGILQRYVNRRFAEDVPAKPEFAEYMYQHWQGDGNRSGERIMNALLHPGAFAKRPLCTRIPSLEPGLPISFCYGSDDWMDIDSGGRTIQSFAFVTGC